MARLFIALALPDAVRAQVGRLRDRSEGIHWAPPEQYHVTMRFLGEVPPDREPEMNDRLAAVAVEPFVLPVEGVGVFPPKGPPRVVWAGTGRGHPRLHQLRQRIDDALLAAGLDFDVRTFHPHITLGRGLDEAGPAVKGWLLRNEAFVAAPFLIDGFGVYASEQLPEGSVHTLVRRFDL
jgi:2'-5' RNA ligase